MDSPLNKDSRLKVLVFEQGGGHAKKPKAGGQLEFELKRFEEQKLFAWATRCQVTSLH
jgi:hypothetical protein